MPDPQPGFDPLHLPNALLFDSHPQPMWVYDTETLRILAVNRAAIDRYGYSREEFLGLTIAELRSAEDVPRLIANIADAPAGLVHSGPWRHRDKHGAEVLVETASHDIAVDGRPARLVMARDVTARVAADDRLGRAETLQRISARVARLGGWIVDVAADRVEWSDEVCAMIGVPSGTRPTIEEALAYFTSECRPRLIQAFEACVAEGIPYDEELEMLAADGRSLWVRGIGEAVRGPDGKVVQVRGALQDISEGKQAAQSLIQSDQRFRRLADAMPQIVWTADPDGTVDYASRAFYRYMGAEDGARPSDLWLQIVHPEDVEGCLAAWSHAIATGDDYAHEFRLRRASDGEYRWHLVTAKPVRDEEGQIAKWYGAGTDVHDRHQADERAMRIAERLNTTLESISDGFYMLDLDWRYTFVNREAERLLRRPRDSLLGATIWEAFPEAVDSELHERYRTAMIESKPTRFELYYAGLGGWFDVSVYPSEEGLAVYFRDITERHEAEARIRDYQARFETLVDRAIIGILVHSDLKPVFANRALAEMLGYANPGEVLALESMTDLFAEDERERILGYAADRHAGREAPEVYHLRGRRRDGTIVELENRAFPIEWAGLTAICATLIDITAQKAMEAQLRQVQRLEAVGQLTGGIAHDFNNLLTVILGNAELLGDIVAGDPELAEVSTIIGKAAERGAELTSRLLAFARRQTLDPKALDVNALILGMHALLRRTLGEQIELEMVRRDGLWEALADEAQLENALLNLSLNARDAMPDGGRLTIEAGNVVLDQGYADWNDDVAPGEYVTIAVSDTGTGMPPEVLSRAFDPFFTTKDVGSGSGLGLSMVFGFVKQSRGHVKIYSEVGQGTTVRLYLPRAAADEQRPATGSVRAELPGGSERILLVEDDAMVRGHVALQLRMLGYDVVEAANGPEALAELGRGDHFDLLFTDVVMPGGMNGQRLAEAAATLRPDLPVLFTSGYTDDALVHHGRLDRGLHFLSKPYRREELAAKLRQILDRDRSTAA